MRYLALCVLAAGSLTACTGTQQVSSTPPTVSYNAPTVSYQVTGGDLTEANRQAAAYCQRYGGTARVRSATSTQAQYECLGTTATAPATVVTPAPVVTTAPGTVVAPAPVVVAPPVAVAPARGPTVSYPAPNNDISSANVSAANYCRTQGKAAQFNGVAGGSAYYSCL